MVTTYHNSEAVTLFGLAADTKPTAGVPNGAIFIEMDTGDGYAFDEENGVWHLI